MQWIRVSTKVSCRKKVISSPNLSHAFNCLPFNCEKKGNISLTPFKIDEK